MAGCVNAVRAIVCFELPAREASSFCDFWIDLLRFAFISSFIEVNLIFFRCALILRINLPNLSPNMNHFDAVDFSECHSEEVMFLLTLSLGKFFWGSKPCPWGQWQLYWVRKCMFRFTACCKFGSFAYLGCRNMLLRDFHLPLFVTDKWVKCYCELILGLASLARMGWTTFQNTREIQWHFCWGHSIFLATPLQRALGSCQYAGFTTHSATSGQGDMGQFYHFGSTSMNISHCIYHTFPLSVGTLQPSKAHTSPEPRAHCDHYSVGALRIIARTKAHALSVHTQWYPGLHKII